MIATGKDLHFHIINPFRLQQNYLSGFICAPETCFFPSTKRGGRHVTGTRDRNAAPGPWFTGLASFQLGFMRSAHRHLCNQQLFHSVCPSRWTSFSRSTWCRETSPRQSTACETWRSLTSTTSWCTRCVGRDSYVFVLLPGRWASSDRRRRGPVLQIHKIKPNPITNNLICELSQDQAFVCFAWLICFFCFFFHRLQNPDIEAEKQATCCTVNFSKNFLFALASHIACRGRISPGNQHFSFLPRTLCVWQTRLHCMY